jgi:hypothetical protein
MAVADGINGVGWGARVGLAANVEARALIDTVVDGMTFALIAFRTAFSVTSGSAVEATSGFAVDAMDGKRLV